MADEPSTTMEVSIEMTADELGEVLKPLQIRGGGIADVEVEGRKVTFNWVSGTMGDHTCTLELGIGGWVLTASGPHTGEAENYLARCIAGQLGITVMESYR